MTADFTRRQEREYVIAFKARRFRWLPWPLVTLTFAKETTWQEAHDLALSFAEGGARDVVVIPPGPGDAA